MNKWYKFSLFFAITCVVVYIFYFTVPPELRMLRNILNKPLQFVFLFETVAILMLFFVWLSARRFSLRYIILILLFIPSVMLNWMAFKYNVFFSDVFAADAIMATRNDTLGFITYQLFLYWIVFFVLMLLLSIGLGKLKTEIFNFNDVRIRRAAHITFFILFLFSWLANCYPTRTYYTAIRKFYMAKTDIGDFLPKLRNLESKDEPSVLEKPLPKESFVLLHIGESLRGDHTPMNGYTRNTTPFMMQEVKKGNLFVFKKAISFSSGTRASVVGILTPTLIADPVVRKQSFLPILTKHGVKLTSFFSSVDPYKTSNTHDATINVYVSQITDYYTTLQHAHNLIPKIEKYFETLERGENRFALYQGEGSHMPFKSYDQKKFSVFMPVNFDSDANETSTNAYDNTIVCTDDFINQFIDKIREMNSVYIFTSDHGEVVGEGGFWSRSTLENTTPEMNAALRNVLTFIWVSNTFKSENPQKYAALRENVTKLAVVSHDHIYHTVLGFYNIKNDVYNNKLDLFTKNAKPFTGPMPEEMNPITFIDKFQFE